MRVTVSQNRRERKKKVLKLAKGFTGRPNRCYELAVDLVRRKGVYQYRDRRLLKRDMRSLWIQRINAAIRPYGMSYSKLIHTLKVNGNPLNRKMLSELAIRDKEAFANIVQQYVSK
jgi:large subunit ribosomal protein L20